MTRAIRYHRFGGPDVLQMDQVADREPGPGEVRVAVQAAGLNPIDAKTFHGAFPVRPAEVIGRLRHPRRWFTRTFPRTVGRDFAGIVTAVGAGVTTVAVGQAVMGTLRSAPGDAATTGSLTESLIAPASDVIARPDRLDVVVAACLGVAAQTASGSLRAVHVGPGDVLVISGASGGVGSLATQLALHHGATVIGIAGPTSLEALAEWGAVPLAYGDDLEQRLRQAAPQRVTAFLDCYGSPYPQVALDLGVESSRIGTLVPSPAVLRHGIHFTGSRHAQTGDLDHVADLVAEGTLATPSLTITPFTLDAVRTGYDELLAGSAHGKLIVDINLPHNH